MSAFSPKRRYFPKRSRPLDVVSGTVAAFERRVERRARRRARARSARALREYA